MRTPLDELVELWTVKDEESGREVIESLSQLREKMALVRDIAYTNEAKRNRKRNRNTTMTKRQSHDNLRLETTSWSSDPAEKTNFAMNGEAL